MSLFFAELRKIWGGRVFPVLLAILASANLLLLWMGTRPTAKQPPAAAYRAVGAQLDGLTMEEKGAYLHGKYTEIESLVKIGGFYRDMAYAGSSYLQAYRYGDHLTPGSELKIEHSVVCENVDISTLITMGIDSLEAMRQGSIDGEQKAYEIVVAAAKQWEQQAAATQTINRALEYLRTPEIEHTGNQWKDTDNWRADQKISNRVYQMTCSIWEDTKYDRETKQSVPIAWYVTWEVRIHSPKQGYGAKIAGQNQKRYTDKNAAIKYLDGRKKAYSHLFTEISPPIPKEYEHHFMVHGTLLPGYTVEGLEQAKTEHAAAEVSEGGIFTPENQEKPSVLGKLSVAKTQEKTPTTPGTAMKKKEDIQL